MVAERGLWATVKKVIDGLGIAEAMKSKPTSAADLKRGEYSFCQSRQRAAFR